MTRSFFIVGTFLFASSIGCVPSSAREKPTGPLIHHIQIKGASAIPTADLLAHQPLKTGKQTTEASLNYAAATLEAYCRDLGYLEASVTLSVQPRADGDLDLVYQVSEGRQLFVGDVQLSGNKLISGSIIRRELHLERDTPFSQSKLFEGNQALYSTGYFEKIDIAISTDTTRYVTVQVTLQERATRFLKGSVGYGAESKERLSLGAEDRNFFGNAKKLDFKVTHSGFITQPDKFQTTLFEVGLGQPYFLGSSLEAQSYVSREYRNRESYKSITTAWRTSLGRRFSSTLIASMLYRFQGDRIRDALPEAETQDTVDISAVGPTMSFDNTNDPFLPTVGWRVLGTYEQGLNLQIGDVRFNKLESRVGRFDTLIGSLTSFLSVQGGMIRPETQRNRIPITERYFIGGANTVRGYSERTLGPRDREGAPIGGNAFFVTNLELRHPLYKKIHGLIFLDGGQLYAQGNGSTWPHVRLRSWNDLRYASGAGIRVITPIGAIRLEFGYQLNPNRPQNFWGRSAIHFSIGEAF